MEFGGAKAALFYNDTILVYLRDNKATINYPNQWDLPGGGREGTETPFQTIYREIQEEFGIAVTEAQVIWQQNFPSVDDPDKEAPFFVITLTAAQVNSMVFGDEGQEWRFIKPEAFLELEDAVAGMKVRLRTFLERYD